MGDRKKYSVLFLGIFLILCLLMGCGQKRTSGKNTSIEGQALDQVGGEKTAIDGQTENPNTGESKTGEAEDEVPVIHMGMGGLTTTEEDFNRVNVALGDYTEKTYGFRLQMVKDYSDLDGDFVFYKDAEIGLDLAIFDFDSYHRYANNGYLLDMEPYIGAYGKHLQEVLDEKTPDLDELSGRVYGIPKYFSDIYYAGALLNKYYVDKYHMDLSRVHSLKDMETLFEIIREKEPDVIPWAKANVYKSAIYRYKVGDLLDDMLCMVDYANDKPLVKNMYETKAYKDKVSMLQNWYKKGYLQPNIMTNMEYGRSYFFANEAFAVESVVRPDESQYLEATYPNMMYFVTFEDQVKIDSACDWVYVWCISQNTRYPKESVMALDAIYGDTNVSTLLLYGLEGENYIVNDEGKLDFPENENLNTCGYYVSAKYYFNQLNAPLWEGMHDNVMDEMEEMQKSGLVSPAYGFWVDESKLTVDMDAIRAIIDQYASELDCGTSDVDTVLPEFIEKLRAAGSEELVRQVQEQVDDWQKKKNTTMP